MHGSRIVLLGVSFAVCLATGAGATYFDPLVACQGNAGKGARLLYKQAFQALAACRESVNSGGLPLGTDCDVQPEVTEAVEQAAAKLRSRLERSCPAGILAQLDFGRECSGAATPQALTECLVETHVAAARSVTDLVYDQNGAHRCAGGSRNGQSCDEALDCPGGNCVLGADQQRCTAALGASLQKLAAKRMTALQVCKTAIGKQRLDAGTDCVVEKRTKLDRANRKAAGTIRAACPDSVASTLSFAAPCTGRRSSDGVAACGVCADNRETDGLLLVTSGTSPRGGTSSLQRVSSSTQCVGGPLSRCRAGDYLLANGRVRVVVQDIQRNLFGVGQFGGQIIDADLVRAPGEPDRDNFEEWAVSLNIENTAHYTSLAIINDGSDGGPAILRATGVDDLLDFINGSSTVASFGFLFPASADDRDLPVTVQTDYILEPDANYVRVETTVQNHGSERLDIFFGEYINGSGQVELFQPGYGFGEPLVSAACPATARNPCNFTAFSGELDADGVSYGYVHDIPGSSSFTTSGVTVPQLGVEVVLALIGAATPPFSIGAAGTPGDSRTFTRYFVVGDGSVSSIADTRNEIQCLPTGRIEGKVRAGGKAAVRADVAVLGPPAEGPGFSPLTRNVITHTRTDDQGRYSLTVPAGTYTLVANLDGHPYEGGESLPLPHEVSVDLFGTAKENFSIPATGSLRVLVTDEGSNPIAAKASVVGFDPSPDPRNTQSILGLINNTTGVFGDLQQDGLPFGLAQAVFIDHGGDSGEFPIEPGDYRVVVSHGPEYSIDEVDVSLRAGRAELVEARVEHVVDTTGFVSGDFHVHSIDSADAAVSRRDRVVSMLADGVDFFAATEHEFLADFQPTIDALGASALLGTTVGQEITTFDYGHFNAWPLSIDPSQVNGGAVDHGGAAPPGKDFPSSGYFSEPPAVIIAQARAIRAGNVNTVQVNHIHSHFGLDGGSGLAIDTALTPPRSSVPALARRLDPGIANFFSDTFDALEIWIGDDRGQVFTNFLGQNIGDWFNLLNQGIVRTGIADSDTHSRRNGPAGMPRTMVASPTDDPGMLSAMANTISRNVNDGRVVGTNGPMVRVRATAASTGDTAALDLGFPTLLRTSDGTVDITVDIQSPTWVEFDTVEYYVNTTTRRTTRNNVQTGAGLISVNRYSVVPEFVQRAGTHFTVARVPVEGTSAERFEATTSLRLAGLTQDAWVVVLVKGTDGVSKPLFPVIPSSLRASSNQTLANLVDGNLGEDGVTALAFTNPLFIDIDGRGWSAPGVRVR